MESTNEAVEGRHRMNLFPWELRLLSSIFGLIMADYIITHRTDNMSGLIIYPSLSFGW
jgi:hypothetical protein